MQENIDDIKLQLKTYGGLLITNRAVGKTHALLQLLNENPKSNLITYSAQYKRNLQNMYKSMYSDGREQFIYSQHDEAGSFKTDNSYIDEYFMHTKFYKKFLGAVATMPFAIRVKKYKNNANETELKSILSEEQFRQEISLEYPSPKHV